MRLAKSFKFKTVAFSEALKSGANILTDLDKGSSAFLALESRQAQDSRSVPRHGFVTRDHDESFISGGRRYGGADESTPSCVMQEESFVRT